MYLIACQGVGVVFLISVNINQPHNAICAHHIHHEPCFVYVINRHVLFRMNHKIPLSKRYASVDS